MLSNQEFLKQANEFRESLLAGKCEASEVVQWADRMIAELEDPPTEIIDLSMMGSQAKVPDVLSVLNTVSQNG